MRISSAAGLTVESFSQTGLMSTSPGRSSRNTERDDGPWRLSHAQRCETRTARRGDRRDRCSRLVGKPAGTPRRLRFGFSIDSQGGSAQVSPCRTDPAALDNDPAHSSGTKRHAGQSQVQRRHRSVGDRTSRRSKVAKVANFCGPGIGDLAVQNLVSKVAKYEVSQGAHRP